MSNRQSILRFWPMVVILLLLMGLTCAATVFAQSNPADDLTSMIIGNEMQERTALAPNDLLKEAAQTQADYLAGLASQGIAYCSSTQRPEDGGLTPNEIVRASGYDLDHGYAITGNNVSSVFCGYSTPESVITASMEISNGIALHPNRQIWGLGEFFSSQPDIGVGYAETDGGYGYYWIVITARQEIAPETPTPEASPTAPIGTFTTTPLPMPTDDPTPVETPSPTPSGPITMTEELFLPLIHRGDENGTIPPVTSAAVNLVASDQTATEPVTN